jgi:transglutaminase-like putative cysteine protease
MLWLSRILAILGVLAAADAAFASAHGPVLVLACVAGALVLTALGTAVLWTRPLVAAALGWMWLTTAFAAGAVVVGGVDAPGAPVFMGLTGGDSAALIVAATGVLAALGGLVAVRNALIRIVIVLLALYVIVPTAASIGHGGLAAALTTGPLAQSRGTYAGAEVLLPLAALSALAFALVYVVQRRGARSALAVVMSVALLAATNLAGFTAGTAQLPTILAFEHPGSSVPAFPSMNVSNTGQASDEITVSPAPLPSMQTASGALSAPQPGSDYSDFIGHSTIDDGMTSASADVGKPAAAALSRVAGQFNLGQTSTPPAESELVQKLRATDAKIPESEYSITALAQTQRSDPIALYRLVRDNVAIDPYNGILRGPLGTWLSRAGSPSDKLTLLASLLVKKGVPFQFVRGTLSDDERGRIVKIASFSQGNAAPQTALPRGADVRPQIDNYVHSGTTFATWASQQLSTANVQLGTGARSPSARHYWVQIDRGGKVFDLDPTLPDMTEGQHLGTIDPSFKPWAMLPNDEWHYLQIRVLQSSQDGTRQPALEYQVKTCDVAYVPLRLIFIPNGQKNFSTVGSARVYQVALMSGGTIVATAQLDLDAHGGNRRVWMEIRRKDVAGKTETSSRDLVSEGTPHAEQGPALAGMASILIVPGSAANLFTLHEYVHTITALERAIAAAKGAQITPVPVYPIKLMDFFSRDDAVAARLGGAVKSRFYRDRPNIAVMRAWFRMRQGSAKMILGFDIVDNGKSAVGGDPQKNAAANLSRGYADAQIERDVTRANNSYGTIAVFDAAEKTGIKPVVIRQPLDIGQSVAPLARGLSNSLASGNVAIAPSAPVSLSNAPAYGWWEIDPSTGDTVGRVTGGAGQVLAEYSLLFGASALVIYGIEVQTAVDECSGDAHECAVGVCGAVVATAFVGSALAMAPAMALFWPALIALVISVVADLVVQLFVCDLG